MEIRLDNGLNYINALVYDGHSIGPIQLASVLKECVGYTEVEYIEVKDEYFQ